MSLRDYISEGLRKHALGTDVFVEAKSVAEWWDKLPDKRRAKVIKILGLNKGKDNRLFDKLSPATKSEVEAYYQKHKGKVEEIEEDALDEAFPSHKQITPEVVNATRKYLRSNSKKLSTLAMGLAKHVKKETGKPLGMSAISILIGRFLSMEGL